MKKISPTSIRTSFAEQLAELTAFHHSASQAFSTESEQSTLTEHSLLAAAVAWESFVSDLFIAYINRDASKFKQHLENAFMECLLKEDKPRLIFKRFGALSFPKHLTKADVQMFANNTGNNITFPNYSELEDRAKNWLAPEHAKIFSSLPKPQKAVVDALIALRNHIAHRSPRSLDAMNLALAAGALHTTGLRRAGNRFHNVGAWLKAKPPGKQEARLSLIVQYLSGIGNSL